MATPVKVLLHAPRLFLQFLLLSVLVATVTDALDTEQVKHFRTLTRPACSYERMNAFLSSLGKYCLKFNPHGGIRTKETYTHHAANGIGHSDLPARCCRGGCTENDLKAMCIPPETPPRPTVTRQPPMMSESQLEEMLRLRQMLQKNLRQHKKPGTKFNLEEYLKSDKDKTRQD